MAQYKLHTFRSGETIDAVIKLLGRHNLTKTEMLPLRAAFDDLNGFVVPRPGMTYKIPTPYETVDDHGNLVDTTPLVPETVNDESSVEHAETGEATKN